MDSACVIQLSMTSLFTASLHLAMSAKLSSTKVCFFSLQKLIAASSHSVFFYMIKIIGKLMLSFYKYLLNLRRKLVPCFPIHDNANRRHVYPTRENGVVRHKLKHSEDLKNRKMVQTTISYPLSRAVYQSPIGTSTGVAPIALTIVVCSPVVRIFILFKSATVFTTFALLVV